ncbi:uncharacterized protein LOC127287331 [Leptopilina boulardi]|uniref:uncharacterized protein LOC127287331 n=1 Tax=Leptopilina boulardi TaxID=63433 RepID=UPI0021F69C76|nr:uncharacterized protein LOC127287331 [Leptopilina boulardi]
MSEINEIHQEEILIQLVEQKKCLFDKSSKSYMDKVKKNHAWEDVGNNFFDITGILIESKQIQNKWKRLKEKYSEERKKVVIYVPSGSAAQEYVSNWPHYNAMQFLKPFVDSRSTRSNFKRPGKEVGQNMDAVSDSYSDFSDSDGENPQTSRDDSNDASHEINPPVDYRTNDYLLMIKETWKTLSPKKKRKCFEKIDVILDEAMKK